jgi:bacterial/archaeal transporter family-2 protein
LVAAKTSPHREIIGMNGFIAAAMLALAGGAALPIQIGINGFLRQTLGSAMQAAFISFSVGAVAGLGACYALREGAPSLERLSATAPWMWIGGFFGVFYVWTTIVAGPRVGAVLAVSLAIAGQVVVASLLDHFGVLGFPQSSLSPLKIAGVALVVVGVVVIGYARQA